MQALGGVPDAGAAVRPASEDDREFGGEGDPTFGDGWFFANRGPGGWDFLFGADPRLSFAVVAVAARLEHEREVELADRSLNFGK